MQPVPKTPTTALVLETNNLAGGRGDPDGVEHSLARLLGHLRAQTRPLASLDEVVVVQRGSRRQRRIACETWRPPPPDVRCDS